MITAATSVRTGEPVSYQSRLVGRATPTSVWTKPRATPGVFVEDTEECRVQTTGYAGSVSGYRQIRVAK